MIHTRLIIALTAALTLATACQQNNTLQSATAAKLNANIDIDCSKVEKKVDRKIMGSNLEWFRNACGLWLPEHKRCREDFIKLIKEMHPTVIRFPGGTLADYYHFKDGIGPAKDRPVRKHMIDKDQSQNNFGTDEFLQLCEAVGAEPMLQINVVTGNASEAAEWVAYCNDPNNEKRKANGHAQPYKVKYWEIGNEQYITPDSNNPLTLPSSLTAEEYVNRFNDCVAAMKKVDPTIKIGGLGGKPFARIPFIRDPQWNEKVLPAIGGSMNFFSVHNGYFPLIIEPGFQSFEDAYQSMLAAPILVAANLEEISQQIDKYCPDRKNHIQLAVTEWAPLFHVLPNNRWLDHPKTLGSALYMASVLNTFLRAPKVALANHMKLVDELFLGVFSFDGNPKPGYYVMQMYSQLLGNSVVQTVVQSPTFASKTIGLAVSVDKVPYLDAVSTLSSDKKQLSVFVVNKHFYNPIDCAIDLKQFDVNQPDSYARTLTGPSMDANNGRDLPPVPGFKWEPQTAASVNPQFENGRPGLVVPADSKIPPITAGKLAYTFPARSLTVLVLKSN